MTNDRIVIKFNDAEPNQVSINSSIRLINGGAVALSLDSESGVLSLLDKKNNVLSQVDLPTEKVIKNTYYDAATSELVIEFESSPTVRVPINGISREEVQTMIDTSIGDLKSILEVI